MKDAIREYIENEIMDQPGEFSDQDSLFERRILDSLGVMQLMAFIRSELDVPLNPSQVKMEDFETIDRLVQYVESLRRER